MSDFSARRAIESAEALVQGALHSSSARATRAERRVARPSLPPGVTFREHPIEATLHAPRWTLAMAIATAPWWLKLAWRLLTVALVTGTVLMFLTIVGLIALFQAFWK